MALLIWTAHGEEWLDGDKVSFNGRTREIVVNSDVTTLDIRDELYSAWVRWFERQENRAYLPAMRFTGLDPIPGGFTGDSYFLVNGWKLLYDPRVVAVTGVLFSDDFSTPYYFVADGSPVFPAQISALVNTVTNTQNVVTGDLSSIPSSSDNATAVWQQVLESSLSAEELVRLMASMLTGKVSGAGTGTETFRDLDDSKDRVVVTVDENGNRTAVVRDAT